MATKTPRKEIPQRTPFYSQITSVKEKYTDENGIEKELDLQLVTLPPGTVLF